VAIRGNRGTAGGWPCHVCGVGAMQIINIGIIPIRQPLLLGPSDLDTSVALFFRASLLRTPRKKPAKATQSGLSALQFYPPHFVSTSALSHKVLYGYHNRSSRVSKKQNNAEKCGLAH
jgi:hypothetical protein